MWCTPCPRRSLKSDCMFLLFSSVTRRKHVPHGDCFFSLNPRMRRCVGKTWSLSATWVTTDCCCRKPVGFDDCLLSHCNLVKAYKNFWRSVWKVAYKTDFFFKCSMFFFIEVLKLFLRRWGTQGSQMINILWYDFKIFILSMFSAMCPEVTQNRGLVNVWCLNALFCICGEGRNRQRRVKKEACGD